MRHNQRAQTLSPPHSQAPCDPNVPGPPFIILQSPAGPPPWGCHPVGEVVTTQKSNRSTCNVQGAQLRTSFFQPSEMSNPHLLEKKDQRDNLSTLELYRPQLLGSRGKQGLWVCEMGEGGLIFCPVYPPLPHPILCVWESTLKLRGV